uniref:Putative adaptor protein enigma n=1 Tax=Xenopsylla cheopis TaxID=163159 RepID=A0A6M2DTK8_XENCH
MAQLISVRLSRGDACPWGFRLQGGKDFGTPLVIQKVNGGSPAERAGLQAGDAVIKVNNTDVYNLRHKDAQDAIVRAGQSFEVTVQRGGSTWQPQVIPTGMTPKPSPLGSYVTPVTKTSLAAKPQDPLHIGSGHNNKAKPFASVHLNGAGPKNLVNKQYNTPLNIYSEQTIKETLDKHSEVLETGVVGVNFKKNEKIYNAANSEVFKMLQEADNEPETVPHHHTNGTRNKNHILTNHYPIVADLSSPTCEICTRFIVGVFVRIKDKNLHVECFKCSTCGTNLKNQGYYTIHNKLYCDIHAKLAARQNPPPGTEGCIPFTVPPGGKIPVSAISAALAAHSSHPLNGGMAPPPDHAPSTPGYAPVSAPTCDNLHIQVSPSAVNDTNQPAQVSHESNLLVQVAPNDTLTVGSENLERTSLTNNALVKITPYNNELANKCSLTSTLQNITETNTPSNGATINGYRKVLPPNQGGSYKLSGNLSGPKPYSFGAPQASPLSPVSAPLSPYSAPLSPMVSQQQGKFPTSKPGVGFKGGAGAPKGGAFGVSTAPKRGRGILNKAVLAGSRVPLCGHCNSYVRGPFISALGRIWCPSHFICSNATCKRPLADIGFVEEQGQLYCEYCFEQFIAPPCDKCHAKIKGDCLNAIGKHFHPECFNCAYCGKLFGNNPFFLEDGQPYCQADWNEMFTTKCFACGFPVEAGDRWVEALSNNYHSQCFNCTMCKKNLEGQSFYAKGGRPFCKNHAR